MHNSHFNIPLELLFTRVNTEKSWADSWMSKRPSWRRLMIEKTILIESPKYWLRKHERRGLFVRHMIMSILVLLLLLSGIMMIACKCQCKKYLTTYLMVLSAVTKTKMVENKKNMTKQDGKWFFSFLKRKGGMKFSQDMARMLDRYLEADLHELSLSASKSPLLFRTKKVIYLVELWP